MTATVTTSHTPGPWKVATDVRTRLGGPRIDAGAIGVADLWDVDGYSGNTEANARLIAAAPDLLALVRNVLDGDTDGGPEARACYCDNIGGYGCWVCAANAAIAKAEGRA